MTRSPRRSRRTQWDSRGGTVAGSTSLAGRQSVWQRSSGTRGGHARRISHGGHRRPLTPWQILEAQKRWVSAPSVLPSEGRVCPDGPIDRLVCRPRPSPEVRSVSIPAPRRYFNWTSKLTALASLSRAGPFGLDSRLRGCPLFPCACWNAPSGGGGAGRGWILFKASLAGTVSQVGHPWPKRATVCNVYLLNWPLWN